MNSTTKPLDLSAFKADRSLSLNKLLKMRIALDGLVANATVIDLDHVYLSDEADTALKGCYITPPYVLTKFGNHYRNQLVATATRGNLKGMKYINDEANEYVHQTDGGVDIVVSGKCVELDSRSIRQVHITCRPQQPVNVAGSINIDADQTL